MKIGITEEGAFGGFRIEGKALAGKPRNPVNARHRASFKT